MLEKARQHLVKLADANNLQLRQNYNREAPRLAVQIGRYAHARQFKRMRKALRTLKGRVGRVHREVTRKLHQLPEQMQTKARELLQRVGRILAQQRKDHNKLYALHAPEVDGRLAGNPLKGVLGDALHTVLCDAGHNIRLLINQLKSNGVTACACACACA